MTEDAEVQKQITDDTSLYWKFVESIEELIDLEIDVLAQSEPWSTAACAMACVRAVVFRASAIVIQNVIGFDEDDDVQMTNAAAKAASDAWAKSVASYVAKRLVEIDEMDFGTWM